MSKAASVSNYEIMKLSKGNKEVRLEGKAVVFDYYESIRSPNVTATMMVVDTGGSIEYSSKYDTQGRYGSIYNALPLTGNEKLEFKIRSALGVLDFSEKPLFVNGAANPDQNSQRESIALSLFSEGAKLNSESDVLRKYQGNIGDSVRTLINQFLTSKSDRVKINEIQKTANAYNFLGNSKSVFDIICNLGSKSIAEKDSAGFFFFETQDGFNFKSIDSLVSKRPVATYIKSEVLQGNLDTSFNDFKILSSTIRKNQNIINAMNAGVFFTKNIFFNPKTFEEIETTYKFTDGKLVKSLGKSAEAPDVNAHTKTHYSILDIGTLETTVGGQGQ